jgi:hypothetical protein
MSGDIGQPHAEPQADDDQVLRRLEELGYIDAGLDI